MNPIQNPAGAAYLIVMIAASVSVLSLWFAVDSDRMKIAEVPKPKGWWVIGGVIVVLTVVACSTAYACLHYLMPHRIPFPSFLSGNNPWVVRGLALLMLFLLGFVIWLTGGPRESWFTSFLLVLIPLLLLLNERDRLFLSLFFVAVVGVYLLTAHVPLPPSPFKLLDDDRKWYKIYCSIFVCLAVFFPTSLQLFSKETGQGSGQPPAATAEVLDGSKEVLNGE